MINIEPPLLEEHKTDLTVTISTKTFENTTGRFNTVETQENFRGVVTHVNPDAINYSGQGSYTASDRKLHTTKTLVSNQKVTTDGVEYRVQLPKSGEKYYGAYNSYILKRAGAVE